MFRIIDRYLLREVLIGWLAITLVLWLILISHRLARYLAKVAIGELPGDVILVLLGVKSVWLLVYIMPFSLALGVVMGLGRMYRDNEMTVLGACGVGPSRLYKPLLSAGAVLALFLGWMALYVSPNVALYGEQMMANAEQEADVSAVGAGRFNNLRDGRMTLYAEKLSDDNKRMENVFVHVRGVRWKNKTPEVIVASSAYRKRDWKSGDEYLVLVDGHRHQGWPGEVNYRILKFDEHGVRIELPGDTGISDNRDLILTRELLGSDDLENIAELQWRLSVPLIVIVLILLSVPLSRIAPRKGRHSGLVVSILVFIIYYNVLGTARVWVEQGVIPPVVGLWWVHFLFAAIAYALVESTRLSCKLRGRR